MSDIRLEKHADGRVWLVTIDRPDKMNALDFAAHDEMVAIWKAFATDDEARVGVVTGAGDAAFCGVLDGLSGCVQGC